MSDYNHSYINTILLIISVFHEHYVMHLGNIIDSSKYYRLKVPESFLLCLIAEII